MLLALAVIGLVVFLILRFAARLRNQRNDARLNESRLRRNGWLFPALVLILFAMALSVMIRIDRSHAPAQFHTVANMSKPASRFLMRENKFDEWVSVGAKSVSTQTVHPVVGSQSIKTDGPETSAWDEEIAPVANVYPGIAECGKPLAWKLAGHLERENEDSKATPGIESDAPEKYRIALKNSGLDQPDFLNFLIEFRKEFTTAFPGSYVDNMTAGSYPTPKDPEKEKQLQRLYVTVYHSSDGVGGFAKWDDRRSNQVRERSGQIVCQLKRTGRLGQVEFACDFIEKPWVTDAEKFVSRYPKRKFIVGFSPRLAASQQEARVSARQNANVRLAGAANKVFRVGYDMERNVIDRFVQKLTMPYGSVWREAILIDHGLPDTSFQPVDGNRDVASTIAGPRQVAKSIAASESRSRSISNIGSNPESMIAGLMFLTVLMGWISNWMTQGYYRGPVWTVAGTVFSIGFLFLIFVVLMNFA
jgi:hypothetical protein